MKKTLSILILGALPAIALAAGDHAGGHGTAGHPMMQGHDMPGMNKDEHASMAGKPGDPSRVSRTIEVTMDDSMRYTPDRIDVKAGETIRFFVKNTGRITHEMVIGSLDELKEHAEMMRQMPGMQHAEPNMVTLKPGQRGGIVWQFDKPGTVDFACLVPGHMEAGMVGKVRVE
ncbi:MAG: cupredoxin family protein [Candidatus Thermoplasmatota archaeon]|nr:cupredoxin family protein [Candidatus Thermoplasmatota archaeon]